MKAEEKARELKRIWERRNPQHEINSDTGEDMFWGTVLAVFNEFAQQQKPQSSEDKVKQLQELAIWMTFCGYDFTQHDYYLDNRHLFTDDLSTNQNK